jgi:hypothetical protein
MKDCQDKKDVWLEFQGFFCKGNETQEGWVMQRELASFP